MIMLCCYSHGVQRQSCPSELLWFPIWLNDTSVIIAPVSHAIPPPRALPHDVNMSVYNQLGYILHSITYGIFF